MHIALSTEGDDGKLSSFALYAHNNKIIRDLTVSGIKTSKVRSYEGLDADLFHERESLVRFL